MCVIQWVLFTVVAFYSVYDLQVTLLVTHDRMNWHLPKKFGREVEFVTQDVFLLRDVVKII